MYVNIVVGGRINFMFKKVVITLVVVLALFTSFAVATAAAMRLQYSKPSDYKIGMRYEDAVKSNKPMLALFYVDWCSYCMKFMPKYQIIKNIYSNDYNIVMINAENAAYVSLVKDIVPGGFPTLYIIDPKYNNRVLINNAIYSDLRKLRIELDRYLRIRAMLDSSR